MCGAGGENQKAELREPCVSLTCAPSPSLLRDGMLCLLSRAELGHLFHISLHAQSRWVTAVIGIRDSDTLGWLSFSTEMQHLHPSSHYICQVPDYVKFTKKDSCTNTYSWGQCRPVLECKLTHTILICSIILLNVTHSVCSIFSGLYERINSS